MQLDVGRLPKHLQGPLAPVYLVSGGEPLQIEESLDAIRAAARAQGFADRVVLHADPGFEWESLAAYRASLSLFAERRLIDLRMPTGPGRDGARALGEWAAEPNPDCVLLVSSASSERLDARAAWVRALDKAGAHLLVHPVDRHALPRWVANRARTRGLELTDAASELLAERNEGNMLACAQEVEKLALIGGGGTLGTEDLIEVVRDASRFGAFDLVDAAIDGDPARAVRIVKSLREEGAQVLQILGAVCWALRNLERAAERVARGERLDDVLRGPGYGAWRRQRGRISGALDRVRPGHWRRLLVRAASIDRAAKGVHPPGLPGARRVPVDPWPMLRDLMVRFAGGPPGGPPAGRVAP